MLTIYGIPNCDTCRKARKWLDARNAGYRFHDIRADGVERSAIERWAKAAGWQKLLNTRSTTWRSLPESAKSDIDTARAIDLMLEHPTLIKRPVADDGHSVVVGFDDKHYAELSA